jgi:hypothetical protein
VYEVEEKRNDGMTDHTDYEFFILVNELIFTPFAPYASKQSRIIWVPWQQTGRKRAERER